MPLGGLGTAALIAAVAAPAVGGVVGNLTSKGDRDKATELQLQALQNIQNVNAPDINSLKLALEKYQSAGKLTPEMEQTINQEASGMGKIQNDPRLVNAQMQALDKLQSIGSSGLRPQDMQALNQIRNSVAQEANSRDQSILQNMQARGVGGAGAELASRLSSSQGAANRASGEGLNIASMASQNALQSIINSGQLGGQLRAQGFNEEAQKANAQDIINHYNAMNAQKVQTANVAAKNQAQAQNLGNNQAIMNANTGVSNNQQQFNKALPMNMANFNLGKAQIAAGATGAAAGALQGKANQTAGMWNGVGSGVGQGAAAGLNYSNQQGQLQAYNDRTDKMYPNPNVKALGPEEEVDLDKLQ